MTVKKLEMLLDCDECLTEDNQVLIDIIVTIINDATDIKVILAELIDCKDTRKVKL